MREERPGQFTESQIGLPKTGHREWQLALESL